MTPGNESCSSNLLAVQAFDCHRIGSDEQRLSDDFILATLSLKSVTWYRARSAKALGCLNILLGSQSHSSIRLPSNAPIHY